MNVGSAIWSKPIRAVLRWQLAATVVLAAAGGALAGMHGALSAVLGGAVSVCAYGASAAVASIGKTRSAGEILTWALLAEAVKIGLIIVLLWLALASYEGIVMAAFFGSFFVTILLFFGALWVRDYD